MTTAPRHMSPAGTSAETPSSRGRSHPFTTMGRIAAQLRSDPRTVALILVVPPLLLVLLYYVFHDAPVPPGQKPVFDSVGPIMLAVLPMILMFIVTSVAMLRERTSGTLERILTTPLSRWNLVASYGAVFGALALIQATILGWLILGPFGVELEGPWVMLFVIAVLDALIGVAFGLLASAFATTEFQAVQFMPAFVGPQIFLCGLLVPIEHMPDALEAVAKFLPMTWAVDVVRDILTNAELSGGMWWRIGGLAVAVVLALFLAARSMPRQTK